MISCESGWILRKRRTNSIRGVIVAHDLLGVRVDASGGGNEWLVCGKETVEKAVDGVHLLFAVREGGCGAFDARAGDGAGHSATC